MKKNQTRDQNKQLKTPKLRQYKQLNQSNQRRNATTAKQLRDGGQKQKAPMTKIVGEAIHQQPFFHVHNNSAQQSEHVAQHHLRRSHKKHQHDHFREDLNHAIANFESAKENYSNALLYPEVCMSRIPFICPVPTALARGVAIYTFTPDTSVGDTFVWSFIPEAISGQMAHFPFYYTSAASNVDSIDIPDSSSMNRNELFPNIQFDSIEAMRVVGSSLTVTQTQRVVDRAGYGVQSRVYGLGGGADVVSKTVVINSTYKDEANFSSTGDEDHLRMVYAPGDFSDLHMKIIGQADSDQAKYPVIQGFVTGYGTAVTALTFEFNVTIEYIPKPILYQMVERKVATVNPQSLARAENLVAKPDTGVNPAQLNMIQELSQFDPGQLRNFGEQLRRSDPKESNSFVSYLSRFGRQASTFLPMMSDAARLITPLMFNKRTYPVKIDEATRNKRTEDFRQKEYVVRRVQ